MSWIREKYATHVCEFNLDEVRGKARPRHTRTGRTYTVPKDKAAESDICKHFVAQCGKSLACWTDEVHLKVEYQRAYPTSRPKYREGEPDTHVPDLDNVAKLVLDALNGIAWKDDSQVTEITVRKMPRHRRKKDWMRIEITYYSNQPVKE